MEFWCIKLCLSFWIRSIQSHSITSSILVLTPPTYIPSDIIMDNISSWFNLRFILVTSSREAWKNSRPMVKNTHSHTAVSDIEDCLQVAYKKGYKPSKSCLIVYWIEFAVELNYAAVTLLFLYFVSRLVWPVLYFVNFRGEQICMSTFQAMNNVMFAGETNTTWENLWVATAPLLPLIVFWKELLSR